MPNTLADELRRAFGDNTRTEMAPDLAPKQDSPTRNALKSEKSVSPAAGKMPDMAVFKGFMSQIAAMPNKILTKAVANDPELLAVVKPFMSGEVPVESIAVPLIQRIVTQSGKDPNTAIADFLRQFGGA